MSYNLPPHPGYKGQDGSTSVLREADSTYSTLYMFTTRQQKAELHNINGL